MQIELGFKCRENVFDWIYSGEGQLKEIEGIKKDIIERKSGGGCLMLFGLPFFLVGMYILLGAFDVLPIGMDPNQPRIFFVGFGVIFASVGAALIFGRSGLTIDKTTNRLIKWWGLGVPMKTKEYNLSLYSRVTIGRDRRKSGKSSRTVYPVRLQGSGGFGTIEYAASSDYQEARRIGEELAQFLEVNLEDSSSGKRIIRRPEALDESLRDMFQRTEEKPEMLDMPYTMRSQIHKEDRSVRIEIPPLGFKMVHLLHMVPGLIFATCVLLFFLRPFLSLPAPDLVRLIFSTVILVFFVFAPIGVSFGYILGKAYRSCRITASPGRLRVEEKRVLRSKVREIPTDELEELELIDSGSVLETSMEETQRKRPISSEEELRMRRMLDPNSTMGRLLRAVAKSGITARSDRETIRFGQGLSVEELRYIHALLLRVITR